MTYKIVYEKKKCIGVGQCALASKLWSVNNKGKAELKGSLEKSPDIYELEISDDIYAKELRAAKSCPVNAIKIIKV